jgi:hypothetical protein
MIGDSRTYHEVGVVNLLGILGIGHGLLNSDIVGVHRSRGRRDGWFRNVLCIREWRSYGRPNGSP